MAKVSFDDIHLVSYTDKDERRDGDLSGLQIADSQIDVDLSDDVQNPFVEGMFGLAGSWVSWKYRRIDLY